MDESVDGPAGGDSRAAAAGGGAAAAPSRGVSKRELLDGGASRAAAAEPLAEPFGSTGWLSQLTFSWVARVLERGYRRPLSGGDVWAIPAADDVKTLTARYHACRRRGADGDWEALHWTLWRMSRRELLVSGLCQLAYAVLQLLSPLLLGQLITSVEERSDNGWQYALGLFLSAFLGALANQQQFAITFRLGQRLRALLSAEVYVHSLSLSVAARQQIQGGEIVNLVANDSAKMFDLLPQVHLLWSAPMQVVVAIVLLVQQLGIASLAGIAALLLLTPLNVVLTRFLDRMRKRHMTVADERVRLCSELLQSIRIVKFFDWTQTFVDRIRAVRAEETKWAYRELQLYFVTMVLLIMFPLFGVVGTFAVYAASKARLTAAPAFTSLMLFGILRFPLQFGAMMVSTAVQCKIALSRLDSFFRLRSTWNGQQPCTGETVGAATENPVMEDKARSKDDVAIRCEGASFRWSIDPSASSFELEAVQLTVQPGELVAVVGPVGSGKSTLLSGILGEAVCGGDTSTGLVTLNGRVAYVAQTAWIRNETVRNNIIGSVHPDEVDEGFYQAVLDACALKQDLDSLRYGDRTLIGEKGVTLSGGQKQRVALARAAFAKPDVLLLDDPLSALDAHTAQRVFDKLVGSSGLLRSAACLLVTHAAHLLQRSDRVVVMYRGRIAFDGPYSALDDVEHTEETAAVVADDRQSLASLLSMLRRTVQDDGARGDSISTDRDVGAASSASVAEKVEEEQFEAGTVGTDVYRTYAKATGGLWVPFAWFAILAIERAVYSGNDWWLAIWTGAEELASANATGVASTKDPPPFNMPTTQDENYESWYFAGYAILGALSSLIILCRALLVARFGSRASRRLFDQLLWSVARAPMSLFETTPIGRIMNRFSFDVDTTDFALIPRMNEAVTSMFWLVAGAVSVVVVTPWVLLLLLPGFFYYVNIQAYFRRSSVQLQRLDSVSRSPIQAHLAESLAGAATIRAFGRTKEFIGESLSRINENSRMVFAFTSASRWLGVRTECSGAIVQGVVALICYIDRERLTGGLVGFALTWAFNLTLSLQFSVIGLTDFEARVVSVERLQEYINLKPEAPLQIPQQSPPGRWPTKGAISFADVNMRYRPELPLALKGLSVEIPAGARVGICGRTGAGKSSIAAALFRLVEIEHGTISVDGIDVSQMGLSDVRGRGMTIIPQDPHLMSGTIRSNLDPWDEFSDEEVWSALECVRMRSIVTSASDGLLREVADGGGGFSVGERQLLCLARALIRKPRVILLDEATASVDEHTDNFIQTLIRERFKGSTLLIIAHRLLTVMDSDYVLVMDQGHAAEFDHPSVLLKSPDSIFRGMVAAGGPAAESQLLKAVQTMQTPDQ